MSSAELDLPLLASAEQVRRREFATVRRGYDPDQVRDFLDHLAAQIERMEQIAREARLEAEAAHRAGITVRLDPYEELASRMSGLLRAADEQADRTRREAKQEAERILAEARSDAARVKLDAQSKAEESRAEGERALREARERADSAVAGLAAKRENLVEQLQTMQERLLEVARDLEATIEPSEGAEAFDEPPAQEGAPSAPPSAIDPRYEDLWTSGGTVDLTITEITEIPEIPEIPPLELGLDDLDEPEPEDD